MAARPIMHFDWLKFQKKNFSESTWVMIVLHDVLLIKVCCFSSVLYINNPRLLPLLDQVQT